MRKYLYIMVCILACFISACSLNKNVFNSESEYMDIIDSGKYYRIYKMDITNVCYNIYDSNGKIVLSEITDRPLSINMLSQDIVDIETGMGSGIATHKYYEPYRNVFSKEFSYVLANSGKLVAYIDVPTEHPFENRMVVVQNIFDSDVFYKEYQLDFADIDTPVVEAEFSNDGKTLKLTYLSGDDLAEVTEIFDL